MNEGNFKNTWKVLKEAIRENDKTCSVVRLLLIILIKQSLK